MTKAKAAQTYTERIEEANSDPDRDNTVTGESLIMRDASNEAVRAYDPQPHDESNLKVLHEDEVLPGNHDPRAVKEQAAETVAADHKQH